MRVIIYGAGEIGYGIAAYLAAEENDVVVIDESADRIAYVTETLDVQGLVGRGSFPDVLEKANAHKGDLLIAVTPVDEFNMMACQVASVFKIPTKIAHIRSSHYLNSTSQHIYTNQQVPVDFIISPEIEVARSIVDTFYTPGAISLISLKLGSLKVVGLYCQEKCPLLNRPLSELRDYLGITFQILCIMRAGFPVIPEPDDTLHCNDEIYLVVEKGSLLRLLSAFGYYSYPLETVVIIGAGKVGCALAQVIAERHPDLNVKLIEKNQEQARYAAQVLEKATVLHGEALDAQFLRESNVSSTDRVICVTNSDEVNVLSALLAKHLKAKHVTALVNNRTYPSFLPSLGINSIITPSSITLSHILRRVYERNLQSLAVLQGGFFTILEHTIGPDSSLIGEKFRIFNVARHSLVGGVVRRDTFMIPPTQDFIQAGDHVILMVMRDSISSMENLLGGGVL